MTTKMKTTLLLASLVISTFAATAAELPKLMLPAGVGVNIHFTRGRERDLDMIAAAGFKFIRMDFTWESIERKKGAVSYTHLTLPTKRIV